MRMNTVLWLRISSVVSVLFAAGHTLGGRKSWSPVGETPVLAAMRTTHYDIQGASRTFLDFYRGFGYSLSVFMFLQAVVLWQLCAIAKTNSSLVRPIVGSFAMASLVGLAVTWMFLFRVPAIFSAALSACLVATFFAAK
jgi:hypothetical protein